MDVQSIQARTVQITYPLESIEKLLKAQLSQGATPDEATDSVLAPYQDLPITKLTRPAVLRIAEIEHRTVVRRVERAVFEPVPHKNEQYQEKVNKILAKATFKVNGVAVSWEEATLAQHRLRVQWLETFVMGTQKTMHNHQIAIELLEEYGVERLADIPDWQTVIGKRSSDLIAQIAGETVDRLSAME